MDDVSHNRDGIQIAAMMFRNLCSSRVTAIISSSWNLLLLSDSILQVKITLAQSQLMQSIVSSPEARAPLRLPEFLSGTDLLLPVFACDYRLIETNEHFIHITEQIVLSFILPKVSSTSYEMTFSIIEMPHDIIFSNITRMMTGLGLHIFKTIAALASRNSRRRNLPSSPALRDTQNVFNHYVNIRGNR